MKMLAGLRSNRPSPPTAVISALLNRSVPHHMLPTTTHARTKLDVTYNRWIFHLCGRERPAGPKQAAVRWSKRPYDSSVNKASRLFRYDGIRGSDIAPPIRIRIFP